MTTATFLSRQEAAARLGVSLDVVDRLIRHGVLMRYRVSHTDAYGNRLPTRYVRVEAGQVDELSTLPREWLERC